MDVSRLTVVETLLVLLLGSAKVKHSMSSRTWRETSDFISASLSRSKFSLFDILCTKLLRSRE